MRRLSLSLLKDNPRITLERLLRDHVQHDPVRRPAGSATSGCPGSRSAAISASTCWCSSRRSARGATSTAASRCKAGGAEIARRSSSIFTLDGPDAVDRARDRRSFKVLVLRGQGSLREPVRRGAAHQPARASRCCPPCDGARAATRPGAPSWAARTALVAACCRRRRARSSSTPAARLRSASGCCRSAPTSRLFGTSRPNDARASRSRELRIGGAVAATPRRDRRVRARRLPSAERSRQAARPRLRAARQRRSCH